MSGPGPTSVDADYGARASTADSSAVSQHKNRGNSRQDHHYHTSKQSSSPSDVCTQTCNCANSSCDSNGKQTMSSLLLLEGAKSAEPCNHKQIQQLENSTCTWTVAHAARHDNLRVGTQHVQGLNLVVEGTARSSQTGLW